MATYNFNTTESRAFLPTNLSASQAITWNITQSAEGSSYFTLETIPDSDGGYTSGSVKGTSGSFSFSSGISNLVADDYKMSAVVLSGGASLTFIPAQYVSASQMYVRGTGGGDLILPPNPSLILEAYNLSSYPGTGTTWYDISGNNRDATLQNNPVWNSDGYFDLDGTEDWFRADDVAGIIDNDFTVETAIWPIVDDYWVNVGRIVWSTHDTGGINRLLFYVLPTTEGVNAGKIASLDFGNPLAPLTTTPLGDQWRLLTISRQGTTIKFYTDGVLENTIISSNSLTGNTLFSLGQEWDAVPSNWYLGKYGGAKVYDRALNEGEIWTNYQIFKQQFGV